jgi:hypothetical protein
LLAGFKNDTVYLSSAIIRALPFPIFFTPLETFFMATLFAAQTTNATSQAIDWNGGVGTVFASGTFDNASIKLQASFDNATSWVDIANSNLTAAGAINFTLGNVKLRLSLSGAGAATSITAGI